MKINSYIFASLALVILSSCVSVRSAKNPSSHPDGEIIAFLVAVNKHEINMAKTIKKKALRDSAVEDFADLMITAHTENLAQTQQISDEQRIGSVETDAIREMKHKGNQEHDSLEQKYDVALETFYMDAMINGHKEALAKIDGYLNVVVNSPLKEHLKKTRHHVKMHLDKAVAIQRKRTSTNP